MGTIRMPPGSCGCAVGAGAFANMTGSARRSLDMSRPSSFMRGLSMTSSISEDEDPNDLSIPHQREISTAVTLCLPTRLPQLTSITANPMLCAYCSDFEACPGFQLTGFPCRRVQV